MIRPVSLGSAIAEHLEMLILEGVLRPGERLLPERELAAKLEVSRPSLREALETLQTKGLIETKQGGTRVAHFLTPLIAPLATLMADKARVTDDYFEFRRCLEGEAASLAALRATDVDREAIRACVKQMTKAHSIDDPTQEANADVDLHLLVYEASHNVVLLHVMRALAELLRDNVFYNRQQLYVRAGVREKLLEQHLAIAETVVSGDPVAARNAAAEHIRFTFEAVSEIRRDKERVEASLQRINRSDLLAKRE